ncbi:hypothetical protein [Nonomuraea sediminis]|nr:hypothetical protein [Nonomuraea sediminis]
MAPKRIPSWILVVLALAILIVAGVLVFVMTVQGVVDAALSLS